MIIAFGVVISLVLPSGPKKRITFDMYHVKNIIRYIIMCIHLVINIRRVDGLLLGLAATRCEFCINVELWLNGLLLGISFNLPPSPKKTINQIVKI